MSSDGNSYPKSSGNAAYPVRASKLSGLLRRVEPLLTPKLLRSRYLKGIIERLPKGVTYSDDELKDRINLAVNELEVMLGVPVFAEEYQERHPFDYNLYKSYIHIKVASGPILQIKDMSIVSANKQPIFKMPADWIDTGQFHKRQINVIPLLAAYGVNSVAGSATVGNAGIAFLTVLGGLSWVSSYWQITFDTGLCNNAGNVPIPVNDVIGCITAINMLSDIAANNLNNSVSLSQDGISQSSSGMGPQIYLTRIGELKERRDTIIKQLKRIFGQKYAISNI